MKITDLTLREHMRITESEIEQRKRLFAISPADLASLAKITPLLADKTEALVAKFYEQQTDVPEIARLIGDADTLNRLHLAQRAYIAELFSGSCGAEYVNSRLRIGMVHKRIGVEPKLHLAAVQLLKTLLFDLLRAVVPDAGELQAAAAALEKLLLFDAALVFEAYLRSMMSEVKTARKKSEQYALALEKKVRENAVQLENLSRLDSLTGLLNMRHLHEILAQAISSAQRRDEPLTLVAVDINGLKTINAAHGSACGDEMLRTVARCIKNVSRTDDQCFRSGGDEFCVIMARCTEAQAEYIYGQRLLKELPRQEKNLNLSIGYAQTGPTEYVAAEALIRQAEGQVSAVKRAAQLLRQPPAGS